MRHFDKSLGLAACLSLLTACASGAGPSEVAKVGMHEGPRFIHRISAADCFLIETQWEKQSDGSRVLWEETTIPLRGAFFVDFMAFAPQPDDKPRTTTMLDTTDHPEKPSASITIAAQKGKPGVVESLATRRLARSMIKRKKAKPSPRNGGATHVTFAAPQVLILWKGRDVALQLGQLERAIGDAITECNPIS